VPKFFYSGFLYDDEAAIKASLISNGWIFNSIVQKKDGIWIKATHP